MDYTDEDSKNIRLDISAVENVQFECIEQCGRCCFYQAPVLTTTEINRILSFLRTKTHEEYENFVIDLLTYNNMLNRIDKNAIEMNIEALKWFWSPYIMEETKDCLLVKNYTIHSMPSTGRCKLLNPIDMKCFVYEARPDTCRIYPFTQGDAKGNWRITLAMPNCPGVKTGQSNINIEEHRQLIAEGLKNAYKDMKAFEGYVKEKCIERIKTRRKTKSPTPEEVDHEIADLEKNWRESYFSRKADKRFEQALKQGKRIIEPLAECGLIPPHFWITQYNEALKSKAPTSTNNS